MHDDLGAVDGGVDALAGGQVAGDVRDAVLGRALAAREDPDGAPGVAQARHDEAAERPCSSGDEDRAVLAIASYRAVHGVVLLVRVVRFGHTGGVAPVFTQVTDHERGV